MKKKVHKEIKIWQSKASENETHTYYKKHIAKS
jgi:hypothetical protein